MPKRNNNQDLRDISLLHTASVHIETFEKLLKASKTENSWDQRVESDLLDLAAREGLEGQLPGQLKNVIEELAANTKGAILCTCSTLGGLAEELGEEVSCRVLRLDRALAEAALEKGAKVAVVMAVASTREPTQKLFEEVKRETESSAELSFHVAEGAWEHFLAGDFERYIETIAAEVRLLAARSDVIALAQASMAPAAERLTDLPVPVLTSPQIGVDKLLSIVNEDR